MTTNECLSEIEQLKRELDEALNKLERLEEAALAVVRRWDQPVWKDVEPTAVVVNRLRNALGVQDE